jgi:hypothetical protein
MRSGLHQIKIEPFWLNQHMERNYIDAFANIHCLRVLMQT